MQVIWKRSDFARVAQDSGPIVFCAPCLHKREAGHANLEALQAAAVPKIENAQSFRFTSLWHLRFVWYCFTMLRSKGSRHLLRAASSASLSGTAGMARSRRLPHAALRTFGSSAESRPANETEYGRVLQKLLVINRDRKVKFGIENTLSLMERLPAYAPSFPAIHVAGTNGTYSDLAPVIAHPPFILRISRQRIRVHQTGQGAGAERPADRYVRCCHLLSTAVNSSSIESICCAVRRAVHVPAHFLVPRTHAGERRAHLRGRGG